jgi:alpha-beta hydrolase superfamily lysophospholipase
VVAHKTALAGAILRIFLISLLLGISGSSLAATPVAHTVMVDGHPFRVWEKSAARPSSVILLVHGRTWSTRPDFDLQVSGEEQSLMDGLVERNITVYGIDLRGYGETPRDKSGWLTPDRATRDVSGVLKWLRQRHPKLPIPALFGWSYGAMVSQLVAQRTPADLSALILFGYPLRPGSMVTPAELDAEPPRRATTAAAAAEDFIVPGSLSDVAVEAFVSAALGADPVRTDWRELEQWQALDPSQVTIPTLLLEGELDPLALDEIHAQLFTNLGSSDKAWVMFPNSDHVAFMEASRDYFLNVLATFLQPR